MSFVSNAICHIHLKGITPFRTAQAIQFAIASAFLKNKAATSTIQASAVQQLAPTPTVLTFQPTPTYTTGRRQLVAPLPPTLLESLKAPLTINDETQFAEVVPTSRGGLTTYHGPGQTVIYPILDLRSLPGSSSANPSAISPRCYIHLLEETTIDVLAAYDIAAKRTENPGVWYTDDEKIASLGVHLRRNVSSYGVGINQRVERGWWDRIEACGLPGKRIVGAEDIIRGKGGRMTEIEEWRLPSLWMEKFAQKLANFGAKEGSHPIQPRRDEMKSWDNVHEISSEVMKLIRAAHLDKEDMNRDGGWISHWRWT
ncbi:lipoyltransferase protein [Rutstroemia sp. NJR-2017a WRK4]|nr:lipoyltransferase protein [Rutstroemia sp. NJR-2017a WRK4]